jgi:hypothetical protein
MPQHLIFGKYTSAGAAGVSKEGFESRSRFTSQIFESLGVKQLYYWVLAGEEWDSASYWKVT